MLELIIISLLGGAAFGTVCAAIAFKQLYLFIIAGICSAAWIFYSYMRHGKLRENQNKLLTEHNKELIAVMSAQSSALQKQISDTGSVFASNITESAGANSLHYTAVKELLKKISEYENKQNDLIVDLSELLNVIGGCLDSILDVNKNTDSSVASVLNCEKDKLSKFSHAFEGLDSKAELINKTLCLNLKEITDMNKQNQVLFSEQSGLIRDDISKAAEQSKTVAEVLEKITDEEEENGFAEIISNLKNISDMSETLSDDLSSLKYRFNDYQEMVSAVNTIKGEISKVSNGLNKNDKALSLVAESIEAFNEEYKKLLTSLTASQEAMLRIQTENCKLLRLIGDERR